MLNPSALSSISLILTAWGGAFLVALWASLIFWTWRDISARTPDRMLKMLALLVVTILFLPGVLIYFVLRPEQTLEEQYQRTLEEEALLRTIEETRQCPGCSRLVEKNWTVCPDCHTRLKKTCHSCARLMDLHWNLCPHCGTPAPGMRKENVTLDEALRPAPGFDEAEQE
jgi:RNA polymerase subunit RPABC4/transcription elongation factor Spt4